MRSFLVLALTFALAACGSDTSAPSPTAWAGGTWYAVLMDGAPLPYRDSPGPTHLRVDSLRIAVLEWASPPSISVYPYVFSVYDSTRETQHFCMEGFGYGTITSNGLTTRPRGATTSIGGCHSSWVSLQLVRRGDSLVGTWMGKQVHLLKQAPASGLDQ